jgi:hypothetical protein
MKKTLDRLSSILACIVIIGALMKILHVESGFQYTIPVSFLLFSMIEIIRYLLVKEPKTNLDGFNLATSLFVGELVVIDLISNSNLFVYALPILALGFLMRAFDGYKKIKTSERISP